MFKKIFITDRNGNNLIESLSSEEGFDIYVEDTEGVILHLHNSSEEEPLGFMLDVYSGDSVENGGVDMDLLTEDSYLYEEIKNNI